MVANDASPEATVCTWLQHVHATVSSKECYSAHHDSSESGSRAVPDHGGNIVKRRLMPYLLSEGLVKDAAFY